MLTVIDHAHASVALLPIYPLIRALQTGTGSWSSIGTRTCAQVDSIVGDTATFPGGGPVTVYLRYAAGGCTDVDGRVRDGSLVVVLNTAVGAEAGDFNAYSTGLELSGLKVRFGMHGNAAGEIQEVTMDSSFIWQAGAWSPRFTGALSYTNTVGSTTLQPDDDTYSLTHVLDGKDRHGATYSSNTSEAMTIGTTCRWAIILSFSLNSTLAAVPLKS